jgi:hypothetical protein
VFGSLANKGAAFAFLLCLGGGAARAQPGPADAGAIRQYLAQSIAGEGLRTRIIAFASPAERARLGAAKAEFVRQPSASERTCRYPASLAYSEATESGYRVVICANNLLTLTTVFQEWATLAFAPPQFQESGVAGRYFEFLAGFSHQNRRQDVDSAPAPCSLRYYAFRVDKEPAPKSCTQTAEKADLPFRSWLSSKNHLRWQPVIDALRASPLYTGLDDDAVITTAERLYMTGSWSLVLSFAAAHEYGHIANGDLEAAPPAGCEIVRRERAADEFAIRFLKTQGLTHESDLTMAHLPWYLFSGFVRQFGDAAGDSENELGLARAGAMLGRLETDLKARSQDFPQPHLRSLLETAVADPRLKGMLDRIKKWRRCE